MSLSSNKTETTLNPRLHHLITLGHRIELSHRINLKSVRDEIQNFSFAWQKSTDSSNENLFFIDFISPEASAHFLSLKNLMIRFSQNIQNARLVKFNRGGYSSPQKKQSIFHLDSTLLLFAPLLNCRHRDFVFILNDEQLRLECGQVYFINTYEEHSLFAFDDNCICLALNLIENEVTIDQIISDVDSK